MNMADEQATTAAVKAAQHDNETGISITEFTDEQIKELCEAATPGPWEVKDSAWITGHFMEHIGIADMGGEGWIGIVSVRPRAEEAADIEDDATFIAVARELVPRLLERTQKAEHLADVYRSELGQCMDSVRRQHEHLGLVTRELNDLRELWRWISVDERLPDDGDMVIARHTSQDGGVIMYTAAFLEDGQWYEANDWDDIYRITHWCPLPAAIDDEGQA